jgi:hypothetical protein
MRTRIGFIVGFAATMWAMPLLAHHTISWYYDVDKLVTLKGVVTEIDWVNPHILFHLEVTKDDGTIVSWTVETRAAYIMKRRGFAQDFAKAGETVSMAVFIAKDGGPKAAMQSITLSTGATATASMLLGGALR